MQNILLNVERLDHLWGSFAISLNNTFLTLALLICNSTFSFQFTVLVNRLNLDMMQTIFSTFLVEILPKLELKKFPSHQKFFPSSLNWISYARMHHQSQVTWKYKVLHKIDISYVVLRVERKMGNLGSLVHVNERDEMLDAERFNIMRQNYNKT